MVRAFLAAAAVALLGSGLAPAAKADNAIQRENALPGSSAWQTRSSGAISLYGSQIGAAPGDQVDLHVSTTHRYRIDVYRLGWYGGAGGRRVTCLPSCATDEQGQAMRIPSVPEGLPTAQLPPIRAGWPVTDALHTDPMWTSGYYLVEAVLTDGPDAGRAATTFFILREPTAPIGSPILVQVPVNTWEAYNRWGGKSLYDFYGPRAYRVSFDRPFGEMAQTPMWWEIQVVRFLEREGYDVSYQTDLDTHRDAASLLRHRAVIVAGHDEYWTSDIRDAFDAALASGTNLAFMGSNEAYWRIKYEDGGRTIFGYKSMYDPAPLAEKTALFREIGLPECMLMGVQHQSLTVQPGALDYHVTDAGAADPWLAGTGLKAGDTIAAVVGREHDVINPFPESCFHPGLTVLLHYDGHGGDVNADAVRYTAPSGARVFASGAQQFSWALDDWRSDGSLFPEPPIQPWRSVPVDSRLQQVMRNMLGNLTRPAAPASVSAVRRNGRLAVTVTPSHDPRLLGFVAGVRVGSRWVKLCRAPIAVGRCVGRVPPSVRPGPLTVGAVAIDQWRRRSGGTFATAP